MKMKIVIATVKTWNINNIERYHSLFSDQEITLITERYELTSEKLESINPLYVFFPHWSWIIPAEIYEKFNCVVFHMTDLPFGRGGSPLQNLIVRGIYQTKISAIKVSAGVDTGDVYFKENLDISSGNADEILSNASDIIFQKMIPRFIKDNPAAVPQEGKVVTFKRRTPDQSEIPDGLSQRQIYDYIRMLDGEGYPRAFRRIGSGKVYYSNAKFEGNKVYADAEFCEG